MMKKLLSIIFCLVLTSCVTTSSVSESQLSEQDKQEITSRLAPIIARYKNQDTTAFIDLQPPEYIEYKAKKANVSKTALISKMRNMLKIMGAMGAEFGITMKDYRYNLDNVPLKISPTGRKYIFLPVTSIVTKKNKDVETKSYLFVFQSNKQWYAMSDRPKTFVELSEIYPDLQGIKPPKR